MKTINEEQYNQLNEKMEKVKELLQIEDDERQLDYIKELDEETTEYLIDKVQDRLEKLEAENQ